jgi:hypothetical protein
MAVDAQHARHQIMAESVHHRHDDDQRRHTQRHPMMEMTET